MILNLFSLPVCKTNILNSGIDFKNIKSVLANIYEQAKDNNADLEKNGGVSTYWVNRHLHNIPELAPLAELMLQHAKAYWQVLDIHDNLHPEIDECWSNIHYDGSYTSTHSHSLMPMVCCFYLEAPPNAGNLVLINPMEYSLTHLPYNGTIESKTQTAIHIQTGDLVFFPGWVRHKTEENKSGKERIVITFNIRYSGTYLSSQVPYPNTKQSETSQIDELTNKIYQQQFIIDQFQKIGR